MALSLITSVSEDLLAWKFVAPVAYDIVARTFTSSATDKWWFFDSDVCSVLNSVSASKLSASVCEDNHHRRPECQQLIELCISLFRVCSFWNYAEKVTTADYSIALRCDENVDLTFTSHWLRYLFQGAGINSKRPFPNHRHNKDASGVSSSFAIKSGTSVNAISR